MKIRTTIIALVILALLLVACGPMGNGAEEPVQLDGTEWELLEMEGEAPLEGTTITLQLDAGRMTGSAGCNNYGGSYTLEDGELTVNELVWTEMACMEPEGLMDQEQRYLSILSNATRLELEGGQLTLRTPDGRGLVFVPSS